MRDETGSSLLALLLLTSSISLFFLKVIDYLNNVSLDNRLTRQSHLCFYYSSKNHRKTVGRLNWINQLIAANNASLPVNPKAPLILKALQTSQQAVYGFFLKNMLLNNYCTKTQRVSALKNFPYATKASLLQRTTDGTLRLKDKQWVLAIPSMFFKKRPLSSHLLEMDFRMGSKYSPNVIAESALRDVGDFPSRRSSSSPPY